MTKFAPGRWFETALFATRWLMAPFYAGLVLALAGLLWIFGHELWTELRRVGEMKPEEGILMVLSLIDLSLMANLVLIVVFSGYESFVSRIEVVGDHDRPAWMGTVDFSGLKMKLISSISAIAVIELLKAFMEIDEGKFDPVKLQWMVIALFAIVLVGVLLALMDYLHGLGGNHGNGGHQN